MKKLKEILWLLVVAVMIVPCFSPAAFAANNKSKHKKYTVVIDPGHGGKDVGAVDNDAREKDINLAVALKVGELIKKKLDDVNVVYTRDKDEYITLQQRANIANKSKADLFVSIHTNSVDQNNCNRTSVCGASVYTLGPQKDGNNMSVARRENSVISLEGNSNASYQGFDPNSDESYIIFEMVQKDNVNSSIRFANNVQTQLVKTADRKDRGVHQAGFWVLWATSMPSALIELDFICNPVEAKFLTSQQGQEKMAHAIFQGIKTYFSDQTKLHAQKKDEDNDSLLAGFETDAVISSVEVEREVCEAPKLNTGFNSNSTPRRRRNNAAAKVSADRNIEVAVIDSSVATDSNQLREQTQISSDNKKVLDNNKKRKADKRKTQQKHSSYEVKEKKHDDSTQTPQKDKNGKNNKISIKQEVKPRLNTYYCVKLFESANILNSNAPELKGLQRENVSVRHQDGKYVYTVGHFEQRQDTIPVYNNLKHDFPQAKVVRVNSDKNRIVQ